MIPKAEYSETLHKASMRPMPRTLPSLTAKYPMHTVTSQSRTIDKEDTGLTFSMEKSSDTPSAQAEYEVLKAILSRENYLTRLQDIVRTVGKKFKPEIADVLDLIRIASLDVIQAIIKWREMKGDADATFVWNGLNYLLKMPSDLDYLANYIAIQKWMGFPLIRNPFCIPYPMESASQHVDELTNPQNINESNAETTGYQIGGRRTLVQGSASKTIGMKDTGFASPYDSRKRSKQEKDRPKIEKRDLTSYIFNEDMKKIRHAESVILAAEARFGVFSRDPQGRLVPILQALTRKAAIELKKDDKRPLIEPATSSLLYAPHAATSDIGIAQASWTPESRAALEESMNADKSKYSETDTEVNSRIRGESKGGGGIAVFETKSADARGRKPIKASISSNMDFRRQRNIKTLSERIEEIQQLRNEIENVKQTLINDSTTNNQAKLQVIRSALSNQTSLAKAIMDANTIKINQNTEKYNYSKAPDKDALLGKFLKSASSNKVSVSTSSDFMATSSPLSPGNFDAKPFSTTTSPKSTIRKSASSAASGEFEKKRSLSVSFLENGNNNNTTGDDQNSLNDRSEDNLEEELTITMNLAKAELEKEVQQLQVEENTANRRLNYYLNDQSTVDRLKQQERVTRFREGSRAIERKRRLLSEEEGKRLGPPPEENTNVYDFYAIRVQSLIRGWLARCWVKWYRINATKACIVLQSALRGWFSRMRVRKMKREAKAATIIQKNFRGWSERGTSVTVAKQRNLVRKAIVLQRVWRGVLGKRRANSKRALDKAAKDAFDAVDAKSLVAADVKELARRLIYAIEEPSTTSFPPDEVLHLLRLSVMIIQSCRGNVGLADYDFFNIRHYEEHSGEGLTWQLGAKMVNRSERFIRLVRAVAYGPGAKPPRLLQLSNEGNLLYAAQAKNPNWKLQTFESMGMGSKICSQLFKWLTSVVEIAIRQQEFLSLIATSFPDWLPKLNGLQCSARYAEFDYELNKKCYHLLSTHYDNHNEDPDYLEILDKEMKYVKKFMNEARVRSKEMIHEINKLKNDQSSREVVALDAMEQRVIEADEMLKEIAAQFKETAEIAASGDRRAQESLSELRHTLTNQKLKLNELAAQKKLLEIQVESNRAKRKDPAQLPPDILSRTILAGEAKAAHIIATVDTKAMIKSAGVKDASDLPIHLSDIYENLANNENMLRTVARARFVEADNERTIFDDTITRQIQMQDMKEQRAKDQMLPTDAELEEERLENENEAIAERVKHLQYLPDSVVFDIPKRPRPVIIAFSRDLPGYLKRRMQNQINTMLPGVFVYLNNTADKQNMGFDLAAMQAVLDANQCIMMNVDHGLTRATRNSFLNSLEMTLEGLFPKPMIVIAVGDEKNMKSDLDAQECGVIPEDMQLLRDDKIKSCLEWMAWSSLQLLRPHIRKHAQILATDLVPRTKSLGIVLEAYFILFSNDATPNNTHNNEQYNYFRIPNLAMPTMIWQRTRQILVDLNLLYESMSLLKRGTIPIAAVSSMNQYLKHQYWPKVSDESRSTDLLLHALATFLEKLVECESLTLENGGIPLQSLTKSSLRGIQAVITVKDAPENMPKNLVIPFDRSYEQFHWKPSTFLIIRAVLQDLRVLKTVMKINNINYTVSVYRENNLAYFEIYDSQTSEVYMTSVMADQIPSLIIPNGYERKLHNVELLEPPKTPQIMYEKLIQLLKLRIFKDVTGKIISKQLICQRDYILLDQFVRKIDGYTGILKCYEGAYGELYFTIYIPEYSIQLTHTFSIPDRMILLKYADSELTEENTVASINEARPLLSFMIDRLHIYPSRTMYQTILNDGSLFQNVWGDNYQHTLKLDYKVYQITDPLHGKQKTVISNVKEIIQNPNIQNLSQEAKRMNVNQQYLKNIHNKLKDLKLKSKVHGKAGKVIYRKMIRINEIVFYLLMKISTPKGIVIIYLYEPICRKTLELRINGFFRKILFDKTVKDLYNPAANASSSSSSSSANGAAALVIPPGTPNRAKQQDIVKYMNINPRIEWIQSVIKSLKVQWNDCKGFNLSLNQTLLKRVIAINSHPLPNALSPNPMAPSSVPKTKLRLLFSLILLREQAIYLQITDFMTSEEFGIELNRENVFHFMFHKTNLQILEQQQTSNTNNKTTAAGNNNHYYNNTRTDPKTIEILKNENLLSIINQIESDIKSNTTASSVNIVSAENRPVYDALKNGETTTSKGTTPTATAVVEAAAAAAAVPAIDPMDPEEQLKQNKFEEILLTESLLQYLIYKISHHLVPKDPGNIREGFKTMYFPLSFEVLPITRNGTDFENIKTKIQLKRLLLNPIYDYDFQLQKQFKEKRDDPNVLSIHDDLTSLPPVKADTEKTLLHQNYQRSSYNNPRTFNLSDGKLETVLKTRFQAPILNLEYELNLLAIQKSMEANQKQQQVEQLTNQLQGYMETFNNNIVILNQEIFNTTYEVAKGMLEEITDTMKEREEERNHPGSTQERFLKQKQDEQNEQSSKQSQTFQNEEEKLAYERSLHSEDEAIVNNDWKVVLAIGCKVNFREGKVTWHGHVSIKIEEDLCWISDYGAGKRYKFIVYEPNVSMQFEGIIRSLKHLREILGIHGQDLLIDNRQKEMLIFICRYRLEVVVNKKTWDGADVEPGAPPYRIEFQTDRLYTENKVTPINATEEEDEKENDKKLFEIENARGKKIVRLVRRISGLLMQLTIFELPAAIAEAALLARPVKGLLIEQDNKGAIQSIKAALPEDTSIGPETLLETVEEEGEREGELVKSRSVKFDTNVESVEDARASLINAGPTLKELDPEEGPVENRKELKYLKRYLPPAFRIVGYDPKSKRKVILPVEPQAVIEVCGSIFSPYLVPDRRRELARIVCESLILYFPSVANPSQASGAGGAGGGAGGEKGSFYSSFELMIPWSGNAQNSQLNTIDLKGMGEKKPKKKKTTTTTLGGGGAADEDQDDATPLISHDLHSKNPRTAADRIMNRKGRIFRSVLRISKYELVVSIYQFAGTTIAPDGTTVPINNSIIVNFYSPAVTEAKEIILSEQDQIDRIDQPIISFQEGAIRTAAIRRLMRYFKAEIIEDILDNTIRELHVALQPVGKDFLTDYKNISKTLPNENVRPYGLTNLFFPLDTCGLPLHRCGMTLLDRNNPQHSREFLVTVYTKSIQEFVERGLILKLYDRLTCNISVLHLSPSEVIRICHYYDEDSLLPEIVRSKVYEDGYQIDEIETGFKEFTEKGKLEKKTNELVKGLIQIILKDLGFYMSPQDTVVPYMKSSPKGIFPE